MILKGTTFNPPEKKKKKTKKKPFGWGFQPHVCVDGFYCQLRCSLGQVYGALVIVGRVPSGLLRGQIVRQSLRRRP